LVGANHRLDRGRVIKDLPVSREKTGVRIGDGCWLGAGVSVLPGTSLGRGAVIGANSVVRGSVPDDEVWAGVPAHPVGERR
ncbi:unnamed protein product, partial [marine sediment metagenome]